MRCSSQRESHRPLTSTFPEAPRQGAAAMHGFPATGDGFAEAPYSTLEEEDGGDGRHSSKRGWSRADLRFLILLAVAFVMAGVLVTAIAFVIADSTSKGSSAVQHVGIAESFITDDIHLDLDQAAAPAAERVVTMRRALTRRRGSARLDAAAVVQGTSDLAANDTSSDSEDDVVAAPAHSDRNQSAPAYDTFAVVLDDLPIKMHVKSGSKSTGGSPQELPNRPLGALGAVLMGYRNDGRNLTQISWAPTSLKPSQGEDSGPGRNHLLVRR